MSRFSGNEGFDEFATAAWPRLRRSAYLLTGDHHLAEDLAQTALVRTYAHWRRVRRADALAYTRRVLVNLNIDRIRRRHGTFVVGDTHLETVPSRPDTRWYTGVTTFRPKDFPTWLYDGVADHEQRVLGDEDGYPVGSTDIGVVVDAGPLRLACMQASADWGGGQQEGGTCLPAMLSGPDGDLVYQWGMGTDDFLEPGSDLELFHTASYTSGAPRTVWVGGASGTDVASVDLVATDGTTVPATVASGTLVPGNTMFWGTVDGDLAMAVTRDATGNVLERHVPKDCSTPVECEVR